MTDRKISLRQQIEGVHFAETRQVVLRHGETMAQMCLELAKREEIAKAGGPVR